MKRDEISELAARFAAAADVGEPWGSGQLAQEIRAMLRAHGWRKARPKCPACGDAPHPGVRKPYCREQ